MTTPMDEHVRRVRDYYETTTSLYLAHVGTTFQAGLVSPDGDEADAARTTRFLATRAGIPERARILDAGCGVCGPALEIARTRPGVEIDAVTISPEQERQAREHIAQAGLAERVRVRLADYHELPYSAETFDQILFLESAGHTRDLGRLFAEAHRVLKPGGRILLKDIFAHDGALAAEEQAGLAEFERLYVYRLFKIDTVLAEAGAAGFTAAAAEDISGITSVKRIVRAMFERRFGVVLASEFGRHHYRRFGELRLRWAIVTARKPD